MLVYWSLWPKKGRCIYHTGYAMHTHCCTMKFL
jgi:hypothetical protein